MSFLFGGWGKKLAMANACHTLCHTHTHKSRTTQRKHTHTEAYTHAHAHTSTRTQAQNHSSSHTHTTDMTALSQRRAQAQCLNSQGHADARQKRGLNFNRLLASCDASIHPAFHCILCQGTSDQQLRIDYGMSGYGRALA